MYGFELLLLRQDLAGPPDSGAVECERVLYMTAEVDYDGEIAERYDGGRSISPEAMRTWTSAVAPHVPADGAIVDIGAGTGRFARPLSGIAGQTVVAVEPSAGMRNAQLRSDPSVAWVVGTAEALPLATGSTGLAWSAFTAHYFDLERVGVELARVLRPGGRALLWSAFPEVFDDLEWYRWFPGARVIDEERTPRVEDVQAAFEGAGLDFGGRTDHQMLITPDLAGLADRLANRSISSLHLLPDDEFDDGLRRLRDAVARDESSDPVYAPNVMLQFDKPV